MASQDIKHRAKPEEPSADVPAAATTTVKLKRDNRAMAKRGLRSLAVAVALPLSLTLMDIYFFGSPHAQPNVEVVGGAVPLDKAYASWFPPLWTLHTMCVVSSVLMGLSAWLVWAEGGFHRKPAALPLYLAQVGLALAWDPVVFGSAGGARVGLAVAVAMFAAMVGCYKTFREVKPIAGDLVKICFAWAALLSVVNLKLVST